MKKIVTLSIVCLVSGHLFAQNSDAKSAVAPTKAQVEAQKQKETSSLSLKQAIDQKVIQPQSAVAVSIAPIPVEAVVPAVVVDKKAAAIQAKEEAAKAAAKKKDNN